MERAEHTNFFRKKTNKSQILVSSGAVSSIVRIMSGTFNDLSTDFPFWGFVRFWPWTLWSAHSYPNKLHLDVV